MKDMYTATMEFITERVNFHGANECRELGEAASAFYEAVGGLKKTLTEEQMKLLSDCENKYSELDGAQMRFFFESGFADAGQLCGVFSRRTDTREKARPRSPKERRGKHIR